MAKPRHDVKKPRLPIREINRTAENIVAYLEAAFDDGDPASINHALGVVARAKGMSEIAQRTGMGRQSLYKALSAHGHPEFSTVLNVVRALGLQLTVTPV